MPEQGPNYENTAHIPLSLTEEEVIKLIQQAESATEEGNAEKLMQKARELAERSNIDFEAMKTKATI